MLGYGIGAGALCGRFRSVLVPAEEDAGRGWRGTGVTHREFPTGSHDDGIGTDAGGLSERLVLSVRGLSKIYTSKRLIGSGKGYQALSNVSLDLRAGEILGVVGESGCGKSHTRQGHCRRGDNRHRTRRCGWPTAGPRAGNTNA